jgi:hypothetical protein
MRINYLYKISKTIHKRSRFNFKRSNYFHMILSKFYLKENNILVKGIPNNYSTSSHHIFYIKGHIFSNYFLLNNNFHYIFLHIASLKNKEFLSSKLYTKFHCPQDRFRNLDHTQYILNFLRKILNNMLNCTLKIFIKLSFNF